MKANLVFTDGQIVMVPVDGDTWPETITYKHCTASSDTAFGNPTRLNEPVDVTYYTTTFRYVGVQYGIGAYVEQQA